MSKETPVCIVGAGPAGAVTSMMLSKMGIDHVIVDKAIFPRDKVCGDGLILYVFKVLKMIDPQLVDKLMAHPGFVHGYRAQYFVGERVSIDVDVQRNKTHAPILFGKRIDFDNFLVENLPSPYADIRLGMNVSGVGRTEAGKICVRLSNGDEIVTPLVIGAEGVQSIVSRKLAGNEPTKHKDVNSAAISAYFDKVSLPTDSIGEIRIIHKGMPLYFYIFPLPGKQANVTLTGSSSLIAELKLNLRTEVEHILTTHPKVKPQFEQATQVGEWRGWIIPSNYELLKNYGDNFLLIGDAAGLTNPFYKEGVGTSMMSGVLAAQQVQRCLAENRFDESFIQTYSNELKQTVGRLLKVGELAWRVSRRPWLFGAAVWLLKSRIERKILRLIDKQTY